MTAAVIDMAMHAPQTVEDLTETIRDATGEFVVIRDGSDVVVHILRTHPRYWQRRSRPEGATLRFRLLVGGRRRLEINPPGSACYERDRARIADVIRWVRDLREGTADFTTVVEL